ncbi:MAG: ROK family protein, partial [bacterium]|nr:ROK family protein [bacterium]
MNKKLITGVDIGGSKINIIAWNGREVIDNWRTEKVSLVKLKEGISYFDALKIGMGVPGILDRKTGCILNSSNLKFFEGLCFRKVFKKDIRLDNDVNCFLRAEAKLGAVKGYKNILAVVMGTGIGGAIIINQKLIYQGSHGSAGEFG